MKKEGFLVDESTGIKVAQFLQSKGFDTLYVGENYAGTSDEDLLVIAQKEQRILITNDKDFGELVYRRKLPSSGVIFLRLKKDTPSNRTIYINYLLENFLHLLSKHFIVVTEGKIRVRTL